jgi:voltage-gated potassium channel
MDKTLIYRSWDTLIIICTTVLAIILPASMVLDVEETSGFLYLDLIITPLMFIDVVVRMRRHAHGGGGMFMEIKKDEKYSPWWFAVDVAGAIPFGIIPVLKPFQLLRLVKLARVGQVMQYWHNREIHRTSILRLVFFAYWLSLSTHWLTCGWLSLRTVDTFSSNWSNYVQSLYWCVQTLATVGYGDIPARTDTERLFAIVVMIFGVGTYGYIIGNVTGILSNIDPARAHYLETMERLTAFMRYRNIPAPLQKRIHGYYAYLWEKRLGYDEATVISSLPNNLQTEVSMFLKRDVIERVPLFKGASQQFIREVALQMRPVLYLPGDFVFHAGEPGLDMYFISRGTVEVLSTDGTKILSVLSDGDFFGEMALFLHQPRNASVRAATHCDLYRLDREMFHRVLSQFPDIAAKIEAGMKERQGTSKT